MESKQVWQNQIDKPKNAIKRRLDFNPMILDKFVIKVKIKFSKFTKLRRMRIKKGNQFKHYGLAPARNLPENRSSIVSLIVCNIFQQVHPL